MPPRPCPLLYVELGLNDGASLRAALHGAPDLSTAAAIALATGGRWLPNATCFHGFEPNPAFVPGLHAIAQDRRHAAAEVRVHHAAAVADDNATSATFAHDPKYVSVADHVVATQPPNATAGNATTVPALGFIPWLRATLLRHRSAHSPPSLVLRMDVEGGEYTLLPMLAASGLGTMLRAAGRRAVVAVEWHTASAARGRAPAELRRLLGAGVGREHTACSATRSPWCSAACARMLSMAGVVLVKQSSNTGGARTTAGFRSSGADDPGGPGARDALAQELGRIYEAALAGSRPIFPAHGWNLGAVLHLPAFASHYPKLAEAERRMLEAPPLRGSST